MAKAILFGLSLLTASSLMAVSLPPSDRDAERPMTRVSLSGAQLHTWMGPTDTEPGGWYKFDTDGSYTLQWTNIFSDYGINLNNGWMRNSRLCGLGVYSVGGMVFSYNYVEFNPATGELLKEQPITPDNLIHMDTYYVSCAYVPEQDRVYGFTHNEDQTAFNFCWSPADNIGDVHILRALEYSGDRANALCWNPEENALFGVTFDGDFVSIGLDGEQNLIFRLPLEDIKNDKAALTYSPYDGCYLYTPQYYSYATQLYYIYPEQKQLRFIRNFPTDNQFFFFLNENYSYNPAAPARPVFISEEMTPGALEGKWTLRMPTTTADGNTLTGNLTWTLYVDNVKNETGATTPGAEVEITVGPLEQGEHVIRVSCTDADGEEGLPYVVDRYFGNGMPYAPEEVKLTDTTVSWTPVTEAILNGYLEPGKMRYEVYINDRFIGSTTETSMDIELDPEVEVTAYYAYVAASCNSQVSERTKSNKLIFGAPLPLPYTVVPTEEQADLTRVVNLDGSPEYGTWAFWETRWHEPVFASGWSNEPADDWLILPPVNCADLTHAYRVTLDAICGGTTGKDERFEVWCGNSPDPAEMTTLVIPETQVTEYITSGWETFSNLFVPRNAGTTYIAIRAVSPPGQYSLIVRNIRIEPTDELADVPASPIDFTVIGKSDPNLTANVSFTMPTMTIAGSEIATDADLKVVVGVNEKLSERSAAPGEKVEMTIDTYQGDNRLVAYCTLNGQAGQETTVNIFTGTIPPNFIEKFGSEVTRDNMGVKLTWEPPVRGQENLEGYYSPEGMHYWLMERVPDEYGEMMWGATKDLGNVLEYTYEMPENAPLTVKYVGIAAANLGGISDAIWYAYPEIGTPYKPEIFEDFDQGSEPGPIYTPLRIMQPDESYDTTWELCMPEEIDPEIWNPDVPYALVNYTNGQDPAKGRLQLPKFSTEGVKDPGLTLTIWTSEPCGGKMSIYASTYGTKDMRKIFDVPELYDGWQDIVIPMPELYCNMPWIQLAIDTELPDYYTYALVGGYRFGTVDINGIQASCDRPSVVFGGKGEVVALGFEGEPVSVCSLDGRTVARSDSASADLRLKVAPGIYVVKAGDVTRKVIVR